MAIKRFGSLLAAGTIIFSAGGAHGQEKVAVASMGWPAAKVIAHLIKVVIEDHLGSEAEIVEGVTAAVGTASLDKGDGSIDVMPDLWLPNQQNYWDQYVVELKTIGHNSPYPGTQATFLPRYMTDRVKSFDDLANPEIAALFDKDGNGKGEHWVGEAAWGSTKLEQIRFKSYGLTELWEPAIYPDAVFKAELQAAFAAQEPILFYYWTPEWVPEFYDVVPLEEPERTEGCEDLKLEQEDWLEASRFECKYGPAEGYVVYSKSLDWRNPTVARFLSRIQFDPDVVGQWIGQVSIDNEHPQDVAEAWVDANLDTVNEWIGQ